MASKNKWAKWIGGGIGWGFGGPIGAIIGYAVGSMIDRHGSALQTESYQEEYQRSRGRNRGPNFTSNQDFNKAFVVLSAAVMKADGKVLKAELDYVKKFFITNFGESEAKDYLLILREVIKQDFPVDGVCEQIRHHMDPSLRLQILHYLFGIAKADGQVDESEVNVIKRIAFKLGLSDREFISIQAMFYDGAKPASAYAILEIEESATDDEVKKAYRKMAIKYHPDKLENLSESHQKSGKENFVKVQAAYEKIKKSRGMS